MNTEARKIFHAMLKEGWRGPAWDLADFMQMFGEEEHQSWWGKQKEAMIKKEQS